MTLSYIALGANLGNAEDAVHAAIHALAELPSTQIKALSSLYRTAPIGLKDQPDFINAVVLIETAHTAHALLHELFTIEQRFGRQRSVPNAARTLDLDLLLHGDEVIADETLTLPHPRMHERAFVLAPLAEIAPTVVIPYRGAAAELLIQCADQRIEKLG